MKQIIRKSVVLLLFFIGSIALLFLENQERIPEIAASMGQPSLPTVTYIGSNVIEMNEGKGYTIPMNEKYMRDTMTPIDESRHLTVRVHHHSNVVMQAAFELRSLDTERLIERCTLDKSQIQVQENYTDLQISFDNLLEKDTEYRLKMIIKTDRFEAIYYYTKVIVLSENYCSEQIAFAGMFSNATFDKNQAETIVSYLEPSAGRENGNLGDVDIHSSFHQITWGDLKPTRISTPIVAVKEILNTVTCLELKYKISALNDYDTEQFYDVTEFFRIKWTSTEIYLLDYYRYTDQVFEENNQNISNKRINLGIDSNQKAEYLASESGKFIGFSRGNNLWMMDIGRNQVHPLITTRKPSETDGRFRNEEGSLRILSVDNEGNMEFLTYGYVNRGEHEGNTGVSLYTYQYEENIIEEKVFIPFNLPYGVLRETVGRLAYVNRNNVMYLMLNEELLSIDLSGKEYVSVVSDLSDDMYKVNEKGNRISWQKGKKITTLDLETGEERSVEPESGNQVKVLGYVGDDFIYGIVRDDMVRKDQNGIINSYMHELRIVDTEGSTVKSYHQDGFYFTGIETKKNMITLTRVVFNADTGEFTAAPDYQMFGNEEQEPEGVSAAVITTERKKQEMVLNFQVMVTSSEKLQKKYPKEITSADENLLDIPKIESQRQKYYVYGVGSMLGIYDQIHPAIRAADEKSGVVTNASGEIVWARESKPSQWQLDQITLAGGAQEQTAQLTLCINAMLASKGVHTDVAAEVQAGKSVMEILQGKQQSVYELTGCSLSQVLYYVYHGQPVLGSINGSAYRLLIGYDLYNAVLLNPETGEQYKQGLEETDAMFRQNGGKYLCIADS